MTTTREQEVDYKAIWAPFGSITITKSDVTILSPICRRLYVGGAGDVALHLLDGTTPLFKNCGTNTFIDAQFDQVLSTNTSATLMVALY